jgi:hypothetical protein
MRALLNMAGGFATAGVMVLVETVVVTRVPCRAAGARLDAVNNANPALCFLSVAGTEDIKSGDVMITGVEEGAAATVGAAGNGTGFAAVTAGEVSGAMEGIAPGAGSDLPRLASSIC